MSFSNNRQICKLFPNYLHSKDTKCQRCIYIYLAAKNIQLEISPARDLYLQLDIHISSQRYIYTARDIYLQQEIYISSQRYISPARDRHIISSQRKTLNCIHKFDFVEHHFVLNFYWLKLSNCRYSLGSYVFFQQEIDI